MSEKYNTVELQASYGIGRQMGDQLVNDPFEDLDIDAVVQGLSDSLSGKPSEVAESDVKAAFQEITTRIKAGEAERAKELSGAGAKHLEDNAKRPEVTVTESGLQYEVLIKGDGEVPQASSTVSEVIRYV